MMQWTFFKSFLTLEILNVDCLEFITDLFLSYSIDYIILVLSVKKIITKKY